MKRLLHFLLTCWLVSSAADSVFGQATGGDLYVPNKPVEGELHIVGSSTMGQLAALWADGFAKLHPKTKITIDCRGSETIIPDLKHGTNVVGLLSRPPSAQAQRDGGDSSDSRLLALMVCRDPVAVIAHPANPLEALQWEPKDQKLHSIESEFQQKPTAGLGTWGQLGLSDQWGAMPVALHAPKLGHGTRTVLDHWLTEALSGDGASSEAPGGSRTAVKVVEHADRTELINAVAGDDSSLGIASFSLGGLGQVKLIPISVAGGPAVSPSRESIEDGSYPLVRPLYLIASDDGAQLTSQPLVREFVDYVLSNFGQLDVIKDGFVPLSRSEVLMQKEKLSGELVR